MRLELKNIKVNERFSEETTQFMADVYVDGTKVAYARNDGQGGCTHYNAYEGKRVQLMAAEAYCMTLPSKEYSMGGKVHIIESNLEGWIDEKLDDYLVAKSKVSFEKKMKKACETGIVWGVPNSGTASIWAVTNPKTKIVDLMQIPQGKEAVMKLIVKVRAELKAGEVIFNTNVPHSL